MSRRFQPGLVVRLASMPGDAVGHEQHGERPALLLGVTRNLVILVPLTSRSPSTPVHYALYGGSTALCDQIRSVSHDRILGVMGEASPADLREVRQIVATLIGL